MQQNNPFFDSFARLATGATDAMMDIKREIEAIVTARLESLMAHAQPVSREDYEITRQMAAKALEENKKLKKKLEILEQTLADGNRK